MEEETPVDCPYCGEEITILVDPSVPSTDSIEDCFVCCRPIHFKIICEDGAVVSIDARRD
jgi:hypothetical protein